MPTDCWIEEPAEDGWIKNKEITCSSFNNFSKIVFVNELVKKP